MTKNYSRRKFLQGATALGTFSALTAIGCSPKKALDDSQDHSNTSNSWMKKLDTQLSDKMPGNTLQKREVQDHKRCDVLVIGGRCSGINTAVRSAEQGLSCILVEKTQTLGGASLKSWAPSAYNSSYARAKGDTIDTDPIIERWVADSHWRVDASAIRQLVNTSGEAVDWMSQKGWNFTYLGNGAALTPLPDYDQREPLYRSMLDASVSKNGEVITGFSAQDLKVDDSGSVVGAYIVNESGICQEISAQCVVIATGGYGGNADLVKAVFGFEGVFAGLPQNIGEGLEMAWKAGAQKPLNFGGQMLHQTLAKATDVLPKDLDQFAAKYPMILCYVADFMNVSSHGSRFRNEAFALDPVPAANSSVYQGSSHYVVISQRNMQTLEQNGLAGFGIAYKPGLPPEFAPKYALDTPWTNIAKVFDAMIETKTGYRGETAEELAKAANMDVSTFTDQLSRYEYYCSTGKDEQFGKDPLYLHALGEGPYYLIVAEENNLCSWGGLLVNSDYQVLDEKREPVSGLYAVGNESGGNLYNDTYVGFGFGMSNALTSGYLCGSKLASLLK